jgi:hypothetical protein
MVSWLAEGIMKDKGDMEIARSVRTTELPPTVISGEYLREKLTKKFLFGLPTGAWLVGNCFPSWIAHLSPGTDRQDVWKHAVKYRAAQRLASVLWSEHDTKVFAPDPPSLKIARHASPSNTVQAVVSGAAQLPSARLNAHIGFRGDA